MSSMLRWLLLIWRYLAIVMLTPLVIALVASSLLVGLPRSVIIALCTLWPGLVLGALVARRERLVEPGLLMLGGAVGLLAALLPAILALPALLLPFGLLSLGGAGFGLKLLWERYPTALAQIAAFGQGKRRHFSAAACAALPAGEVFDALRVAPGLETPLHSCGAERDDGWFSVTQHFPDLLAERAPAPLDPATEARWSALHSDPREAAPAPESLRYARILEQARHDQTVAYSDGDGVSLTVVRLSVTPQRKGCVVRESTTTNTMGLLAWFGASLQNRPLWSLAARLDHLATGPNHFGSVNAPTLTGRNPTQAPHDRWAQLRPVLERGQSEVTRFTSKTLALWRKKRGTMPAVLRSKAGR